MAETTMDFKPYNEEQWRTNFKNGTLEQNSDDIMGTAQLYLGCDKCNWVQDSRQERSYHQFLHFNAQG